MNRTTLVKPAFLFAATAALSSFLFAASGTWTGGSGNWSDTANWDASTIADGANETATFNNASAIEVTVDADRIIGHVNKASGAGNLTIGGANTLTLQDATQPTFSNAAAVTFIKAPLAGTMAFAKYGASRLVMCSNPVHAMSGNILVNEGELRFDSAGHTIPGVGQVYVQSANAAARLHYTTAGDPVSFYPCTFHISGQAGLTSGSFANYGPLFAYGDNVEAAISNVIFDMSLGQYTRIGQGGQGGKITFHGDLSGDSFLEFFVNGDKTFDFIGSNTYAQATFVTLANNTSRAVLNILGPQRLPNSHFQPDMVAGTSPGGECVIDVHEFQQETTYNHFVAGTLRITSTPSNGSWWAHHNVNNHSIVLNQTNIFIVDNANVVATGHIVNREDSQLIVTNNGYLYCGLELLQGLGDGTSYAKVTDGGYARIFVFRAASTNPGTFDVEPGGRLAIAGAWTGGSATFGTLNLNGGVLSDWNDNDWGGGGSANWIQENINVIVKAGGARIQVDHPSGRVLQKVLQNGGGGGGLTTLGSGVLTLTANNAYTGNTTVESGTLKITAQGAIPAASPVIEVMQGATCDVSSITAFNVGANQTFKGNGLVVGSLNIQNGATIAPGASIGALTITHNLTFESGACYQWEAGTGASSDFISVEGSLALPASPNAVTVQVALASSSDETNTYTLASALGGINGTADSIFMDYGSTGIQGPDHPTSNGSSLTVELIIPEPAAALTFFCALFAVLRSPRRTPGCAV